MPHLFTSEIRTNEKAQERVRAWIAALRSDEYKQGFGRLRTNDGYCCLGVACDVLDSSKWNWSIELEEWTYESGESVLPKNEMNALCLKSENGSYTTKTGDRSSLVTHNDSRSVSLLYLDFYGIANMIESELELALTIYDEDGNSIPSLSSGQPTFPPEFEEE